MAKTQLLLSVVLWFLASQVVDAAYLLPSDEEMARARSVVEASTPAQSGESDALDQTKDAPLMIFVSFSMADAHLKQLIAEANQVGGSGAVLVFRGLIHNSFQETVARLHILGVSEESAAILIDPPLFTKYQVASVPTYIRACGAETDRMEGAVSVAYVLEHLNQEGACAAEKEANHGA